MGLTFSIHTLGCRANQADSEQRAQILLSAGFEEVAFGQPADCQVVNTCTVTREADRKSAELEAALRRASDNGRHPIVLDASACTLRMKTFLAERLPVFDLVEFAHDALLPRLMLQKKSEPVLLHLNCSARRMGFDAKLNALARACATQIVQPAEVKCCGFGGDRGFAVPELNAHALRKLHADIPAGCCGGYSSNQTCEIGLTQHGGIDYHGLVYLVDRVTS